MTRLRQAWLPVAFCMGGLVLAHHETVLHGFGFTQNDLGDTRLVNYLLEHVWRWLTFDPNHARLWSPPYFYPTQETLAWSENMIGAVPFYAPWRLLLPADSAFQAWALTVGTLNFVAVYFFARRCLTFSQLAASVAAALFAFSYTRVNQTMHWQLFPHCYTVWAFHALYRLTEGPADATWRTRWIALFFGSAVLQLYASIYLGWFLLFSGTLAVLALLLNEPTRVRLFAQVRQAPFTLALALGLSAAVLWPLVWRYLEVEKLFGGRPFEEVLTMLPMPRVWLHFGEMSWLYAWTAKLPFFSGIPMEHEQRDGFGYAVLAAAVIGLWLHRKAPTLRFIGLLTVVLVALSTLYFADFRTGDMGWTPWKFIHTYFPGAKAIRGVARLGILYMLGVGLLAASTVQWLEERFARPGQVAAFALGAFLLVEQGQTTPAFDKALNRRDIAAIASAVGPTCEAFLFSPVQGYGPYWKYQLDAVWAGTEVGKPTLNGYSGQNPPGWTLGEVNLRGQADETRVSQSAAQWAAQNKLQLDTLCWVKLPMQDGPYSMQFVSQTVPASMVAGATAAVEVTLRNTGTRPWLPQQLFRLGSQPQDTTTWGLQRVELPGVVGPGEPVTLRFSVTAPTAPGRYPFQWRLVQDGVMWFGLPTPLVDVDVQ